MKKTTKGLLSALLLTAMCGTVGCKPEVSSTATPSTGTSSSVISSTPETVEDVNLISRLADGGQGVYTVTNENGKASVTYTKNSDDHKWAFVKADINEADKMNKMNTLKFALSGVGTVIIKLEGTSGAVEVKMLLSDVSSPYELNLLNSKDKIGDANKVVIFAAPDSANATGSFVVDELTLTANDPDNYIVNPGWSNIDPDSNVYDGVADTFSFNKNWIDNDQVIHKFTYNDDGTVIVDYNKGAYSWAFAYAEIAGKYGAFPYITFKVQGTAGEAVLFKVEPTDKGNVGNKEIKIDFDGTVQTVTLDLSEYTEEQRSTISRVLMFGAPGVTATEDKEATGTYTIHAAYFTHNYEGEKPVVYEVNEYDGKSESFGVNNYWHDNGDKCYEVEGTGPVKVTYTNVGEWSTLRTLVNGKLGNFSRIDFGVKVAEGKEIMVKAGGKEVKVTGTGEYDGTCSLDLSDLSVADRNNIKDILIFAEPGVAGVSGEFEIHWMSFNGFTAQDPEKNEFKGYGRVFNVNKNWYDNGNSGYYTIGNDNGTTITWDAVGGDWTCVANDVTGDFSVYESLQYSVVIPEGKTVKFKLEGTAGAKEWDLVGTGEVQTGTFDLTAIDNADAMLAGLTKVVVFPTCGAQVAAGEGATLKINTFQFCDRDKATIGTDGVVDHSTASWFDLGEGVYTLTREENNSVTVAYNENKGDWACAGLRIAASKVADAYYSKVQIKVKGVETESALFKMENDDNGGANVEQRVVFDGTTQTVELDLTNVNASNPEDYILVFFGNPGAHGTASSFVVESVTFVA